MEVEENVQLSFWGSVVFAGGTSEEKLRVSKVFWRFKVHFVCFYCTESLFWNGNALISIGYWRFSQVKVKLKQIL